MDFSTYVNYIRQEINQNDYADYVHVFHEYKEYLEQQQKDEANIVAATCQLAAVYFELRYESPVSIDILEALLVDRAAGLTPNEKARIYTNLAFYYEDDDNKDKCLRCLKEAVTLKPDFPNAYDALGCFYAKDNDRKNSFDLLEKACSFSSKPKYPYNYGVALFQDGNIVGAKEVFGRLLSVAEAERRIPYAYGVCCALTGDIQTACKIADELALDIIDDYISGSEVADLYFLCGEYAKHNVLYDNERYAISAGWLAQYFYSLKTLGNLALLHKKYLKFISEVDYLIKEAMAEELDETYTLQDKTEFVASRKHEKNEIIHTYNAICSTDYKPQLEIKLWFMSGCYLVDCPRHQCI